MGLGSGGINIKGESGSGVAELGKCGGGVGTGKGNPLCFRLMLSLIMFAFHHHIHESAL